MLGSLLVTGSLLFAGLLAIFMYYNRTYVAFILVALFFGWSSLSYFFSNDYMGWPANGKLPRSQVIAISVTQADQNNAKGKIHIWVMHIEKTDNSFWKYNPEDTPRAYNIPYTDKSQKAFAKAQEMLQDGNLVFVGGEMPETIGEGKEAGPDVQKNGGPSKDKYNIIYDADMPPIDVVNPRALIAK